MSSTAYFQTLNIGGDAAGITSAGAITGTALTTGGVASAASLQVAGGSGSGGLSVSGGEFKYNGEDVMTAGTLASSAITSGAKSVDAAAAAGIAVSLPSSGDKLQILNGAAEEKASIDDSGAIVGQGLTIGAKLSVSASEFKYDDRDVGTAVRLSTLRVEDASSANLLQGASAAEISAAASMRRLCYFNYRSGAQEHSIQLPDGITAPGCRITLVLYNYSNSQAVTWAALATDASFAHAGGGPRPVMPWSACTLELEVVDHPDYGLKLLLANQFHAGVNVGVSGTWQMTTHNHALSFNKAYWHGNDVAQFPTRSHDQGGAGTIDAMPTEADLPSPYWCAPISCTHHMVLGGAEQLYLNAPAYGSSGSALGASRDLAALHTGLRVHLVLNNTKGTAPVTFVTSIDGTSGASSALHSATARALRPLRALQAGEALIMEAVLDVEDHASSPYACWRILRADYSSGPYVTGISRDLTAANTDFAISTALPHATQGLEIAATATAEGSTLRLPQPAMGASYHLVVDNPPSNSHAVAIDVEAPGTNALLVDAALMTTPIEVDTGHKAFMVFQGFPSAWFLTARTNIVTVT